MTQGGEIERSFYEEKKGEERHPGGERESEEDRETKKGRDKDYTLRSWFVTEKKEREMVETGRGLCDRGISETGEAHRNRGTKGRKGVDSLVTPSGND